ncbi:WW domain-containing protein, putative isoform 4 [Melia azedarach]|uniref:WW domain-containing protein, putative isoform 4 n=2 Tax=Melia azedarach TaxID=155640 RepID=A0ACC1YNK8_MELAZ|nr:WW domain-containing protein, putative isoform 4 [Melia azedarach]
MGKRKDRVLAAMSNAGRRVKLDLSAEPSGDLGGSSVHDDVGEDTESKERAGLPNSPSSSGQQQQNPLLLLGQYSDDEMDEQSDDRLKGADAENSSVDNESLVKVPSGEKSEDKDVNTGKDLAALEVKQLEEGYVISPNDFHNPEVIVSTESDATALVHLHTEMSLSGQTSATGSSAIQVIGDVTLGWKMYPHFLAQTTQLTDDQQTTIIENTQSTAVATNESNSSMGVALDYYSTAPVVDGAMDANVISQSKDAYECAAQINETVEGSKSEVLKNENGTAGVSQIELSSTVGASDDVSSDRSLIDPGMYIQGSMTNEENTMSALCSSLVKRSEELLQKLKSFEGSKGHLQGHDWTSKYVLEVEIRLSDFKSLVAYGSSLLPFWLHSERQLKRLEGAIDEEIYQIAKSQVDEVMGIHISPGRGEDKSLEIGQESQAVGIQNDATLSTSIISKVSPTTSSLTGIEKDLCKEDSFRIAVDAENPASGSPTRHLVSGSVDGEQVNGTVHPDEFISHPGYHAEEDVDMDVDMEVEEPIPAESTSIGDPSSAKDFAPQEQPVQPNPPADHPSLPSEAALIIPPPPDDEWIPPPPPDNEQVPPPPPDNEQVPPPPPDDPPEPSYPPTTSYMKNAQPLPYTDQYNLPYPDSSFTYYGHAVTEIPSNFYGHADGSQIDAAHASIYYGAVPNTYDGTASVMVNPVVPVAYYRLQDGTVPVASSIESFQNHSQSGHGSGTTPACNQVGSVDPLAEAGTKIKDDVSAGGGGTDVGSMGVPSTSATIQAPAIVSEKENISSLSITAVGSSAAAATTLSTSKVQSKVRTKKRTVAVAPSLRSNKKVSSLVDKWKAAKEELNENEEDEPENAYEILEKKRQREIEEWYAQQIASGEAKDNANFQPLGGDWREKVKRRRAQKAKEAAETPSEVQTDGNRQQQPDLEDISRDLPSSWKAYWDETSKQVYYGNTITAKTTWTRPKKLV